MAYIHNMVNNCFTKRKGDTATAEYEEQQVWIRRISSLSKILENEVCVGTVSQNSWHTVNHYYYGLLPLLLFYYS